MRKKTLERSDRFQPSDIGAADPRQDRKAAEEKIAHSLGFGTSRNRRNQLPRIEIRSAGIWILALVSVAFLLRYAKEVFIPIVLAILIAYALEPVVTALTRSKLPRSLAAATVLIVFLILSGATVHFLGGQAMTMLNQLPESTQRLREVLKASQGPDGDQGAIGKVKAVTNELEKTANELGAPTAPSQTPRVQVEAPLFRASDYLWVGSLAFFVFVAQATVVLFLVYFFLASGDLYKRKLVNIIGSRLSEKRLTVEILHEIDKQIKRFLLVQVVICLAVGLAIGIALWFLGFREPAVWGLACGVLNSIPYFGPILATAGVALVSLVQFTSLTKVAEVVGVVVLLTTLDGYLVKPELTGKAARMNQVAVFVGLLFWTWVWGVVGMILAVPVMVVIKSVCDRVPGLQPVGELLGE